MEESEGFLLDVLEEVPVSRVSDAMVCVQQLGEAVNADLCLLAQVWLKNTEVCRPQLKVLGPHRSAKAWPQYFRFLSRVFSVNLKEEQQQISLSDPSNEPLSVPADEPTLAFAGRS